MSGATVGLNDETPLEFKRLRAEIERREKYFGKRQKSFSFLNLSIMVVGVREGGR